jgi:O-antigen/teichoic acid export membrane protein
MVTWPNGRLRPGSRLLGFLRYERYFGLMGVTRAHSRADGPITVSSTPLEAGAPPLEEPDAKDLSGHVARGLGWKLFSQITTQGSRLIVGIVLARLLTPHEFGQAAMALVVSAFVISFADVGLGAALVQRKTLTEDDRSTAFWTSLGAGALLSILGFVLAPFVGDFYGDDAVSPLVAVISLSFVITSLGTTHRSLLFRAMDFRSLELRFVIGTLVAGATAILLAVAGYGPWAFVGSELALASVSTVLVWSVLPWRPHVRFSRDSLRDLGGFGLRAFGGATFTSLSRNADNILIGRYIGAYALGLYAFAYNLMLASLTRIVLPLQQVIFPALSRIQDDPKRLGLFWLRANRFVAATCGPLLCIVIVTAPDLIPLVFGNHWRDAVPLVQILCWAGLVDCLVALNDVVLKAQDATKAYLRFTTAAFVVNLAAFVVGLHWGVHGVATAFAISTTLLGVVYTWLAARKTNMSVWEMASALSGVAVAVVGMTAACLVTRRLLVYADAPAIVRLIATVEVAVAAYVLLGTRYAPEVITELRGLLSRRGRRATVVPST